MYYIYVKEPKKVLRYCCMCGELTEHEDTSGIMIHEGMHPDDVEMDDKAYCYLCNWIDYWEHEYGG